MRRARRVSLELLLANHPLGCPVCERSGRCELQDVTFEMDGDQDKRLTIGGTLNLGMMLNAEMSMGENTAYTFGILFGF